jgi:hypothetical protein
MGAVGAFPWQSHAEFRVSAGRTPRRKATSGDSRSFFPARPETWCSKEPAIAGAGTRSPLSLLLRAQMAQTRGNQFWLGINRGDAFQRPRSACVGGGTSGRYRRWALAGARPATYAKWPVSNREAKADASHTRAVRKRGEHEHTLWIGDGRELHDL